MRYEEDYFEVLEAELNRYDQLEVLEAERSENNGGNY